MTYTRNRFVSHNYVNDSFKSDNHVADFMYFLFERKIERIAKEVCLQVNRIK